MICARCKRPTDPILTYARPHGRYSKCEDCRKEIRERKRAERRALLASLGVWRSA